MKRFLRFVLSNVIVSPARLAPGRRNDTRVLRRLPLIAAVACSAFGQSYTIHTVAGGGMPATPMAAVSAPVRPVTVAVDSSGNVYFSSGNAVFKIDATGTLTRVAGAPGGGNPLGDGGPATSAYLNSPYGVAVDSAGNLYISETNNSRVRKVTPAGVISTVAGTGVRGYSGDGGPAATAHLSRPMGLAVDAAGDLLIADMGNDAIRKVTQAGIISTLAGGSDGYAGDGGPATGAKLNSPMGVAADSAGNIYIADTYNSVVRQVTPGGIISTWAGGGTAVTANGPATGFKLGYPEGVGTDALGNVYIGDNGTRCVYKVTASGTISALAGGGSAVPGDGGQATSVRLSGPESVATDSAGNLYIADNGLYALRKVTPAGIISTVAGTGNISFGDGGPATSAGMNSPAAVAVDSAGNLYISDDYAHRIRKVTPAGTISTVAGTGAPGYSGDGGPAASAQLYNPTGVAFGANGDLYIADSQNYRIRKVTPAGTISTVAGGGSPSYSGDGGPATAAGFGAMKAITVDSAGNVYLADIARASVRKVTATGTISTLAGNGIEGYSGDGGPSTAAQIGEVNGLAVDAAGNLYLADNTYHRIRKITPAGIISTVAGNGTAGFAGDGGPATSAEIRLPNGVAVDSSGNLFITDAGNLRIRMVTPGGTISTIAGNGSTGYTGDNGAATSAGFVQPAELAVDGTGKVYAVDYGANAVRVLTLTPAPSVFAGGVIPVGSAINTIQPGEWISIYGSNLAGTTAVWNNDFPTSLGGTSVTIDGKPAYIWYVSPGQINVQVPDDSSTGTVSVVVTTAGGSATSSATLAAVAPAFLLLDSTHVTGIILRSNNSGAYGGGTYDIIGPTGSSLGYPTVAAKAGDVVELYATGFGPTNPAVPSGHAFSGAAWAVDAVNVKIGDWNVTPSFAGLSGAGLVQINLTIPGGLGTGDVPLVATVGGSQTPSTVVIALQ